VPRFGREVPDCFFLPADEPAEVADLVVDLVARRLPARYGFGKGEVQALVPMHRGVAGVGALNQLLQERLNPGREGVPEARSGGRAFRPGDRVLQLKNDYDLGVFNGDLGTVQAVDPDEAELLLALDDGREVRYPFASLYSLAHAFSISVHKSQGAEFPAVVLPLVTSYAMLLGRTLLYTAFTRAKRLVVCVGQEKALRMAVKDWRRVERRTALAGILDGTLEFAWPKKTADSSAPADEDRMMWEGLLEAVGDGE
jgi:exodeoxyribonuclease V alpha subunit